MRLVIASHDTQEIEEFRRLMNNTDLDIVTIDELGIKLEPIPDEDECKHTSYKRVLQVSRSIDNGIIVSSNQLLINKDNVYRCRGYITLFGRVGKSTKCVICNSTTVDGTMSGEDNTFKPLDDGPLAREIVITSIVENLDKIRKYMEN